MTKKDYKLIAETLKTWAKRRGQPRELSYVASALAEAFSRENQRFDPDKFFEACGVSYE